MNIATISSQEDFWVSIGENALSDSQFQSYELFLCLAGMNVLKMAFESRLLHQETRKLKLQLLG